MLRLLGNICWFVFGGFIMGCIWLIVSGIAYVSIVGIPWGKLVSTLRCYHFYHLAKILYQRAFDKTTGYWNRCNGNFR